jgi:hypothetical protein
MLAYMSEGDADLRRKIKLMKTQEIAMYHQLSRKTEELNSLRISHCSMKHKLEQSK